MMRFLVILVFSLFLFGCTIIGGESNETNQTIMNETNQTNETKSVEPKLWERYATDHFSFEYPIDVHIQESENMFRAEQGFDGKITKLIIVSYENLSQIYNYNQLKAFQEDPSQTPSDFLLDDEKDDPFELLDQATETEAVDVFSISRDAYVAQMPFKVKLPGSDDAYTGYALSIYIPERSLHVMVRIVALSPRLAENINDRFLLSFRLE